MRRGAFAAGTALAGAATLATLYGVQRRAVGQARRQPDPFAGEPLGELHTEQIPILADDGVCIAAEVDGDPEAPVTLVFVHGYTLSMDCWHFQRRHLRDIGRLVFYDQRSHGRSGRSDLEHATIDQLGSDLERVLEHLVPDGPVVLVGHSMGGMTILALADRRPDLFGERVIGAALLSTSAGALAEGLFGLPGWASRSVRPLLPAFGKGVRRGSQLVERTRRAGSPASYLATRWLSYGPEVSPSLVDFMEAMIAATPIEVMSDFFDTLLSHDKLAALPVLAAIPTLVMCGTLDVLTPLRHSKVMAEALPSGELMVIDGAGHMAIIDRHEHINAGLRRLLDASVAAAELRRLRQTG